MSLSRLLKSSYTHQVFTGIMDIPVIVPVIPEPESEDTDEFAKELSIEEERAIALDECKRMREQALRDANQLIEEAKAEAAKVLEDARIEGYQVGFEEGRVNAESEFTGKYNSIIANAQVLVSDIESGRLNRLQNMNEIAVQLTMESVHMVIQRELELAEPNIEAIVSDLIQYVIESTRIEVRVHPDDAKAAMTAHPKWSGMKFGEWDVVIVPDLRIGRGGCEIRSQLSRVDARTETQLELLETTIRRIINGNMVGEE